MKKIMIAFAAIATAVAANAGAINWSCSGVVDPTDSSKLFIGGSAYLFLAAAVPDDISDAIKAGTWTAAGNIGQASFDGENLVPATDSWNELQKSINGYTGKQTGYMVLFDAEDYADAKYFMVSDAVVTTAEIGTAGSKPMNFSTQMTTWQSVPEPTSGLLLLLGVAGLALKRKRA